MGSRVVLAAIAGIVLCISYAGSVRAQDAALLLKIDDHTQKIKQLEAEIGEYQKQLDQVGAEKRTLQNSVKEIDLSRKKASTGIQVEERRITELSGNIEQLEGRIDEAAHSIAVAQNGIRALIARMDSVEQESLVEALLQSTSLEDVWNEVDRAHQINASLRERTLTLAAARETFTASKTTAEEKRMERLERQNNLRAQKKSLDISAREKQTLLKTTNAKESEYQKQLEAKRVAKLEFEASLRDLESQLQYSLDPSHIPAAGKGILRWPLDQVFITQHFGDTDFARSGAYNGHGHNGVDFRATIGTPVRASLSGVVAGTGNTDLYRGCYSYGKWVLIKHANGLSTLYAHLSNIDVSSGQSVETGSVIGYSGSTGYATGPHLHFSVYVSEAVKLVRLGDVKSKTNCANATIPIAPLNAYLDPLEYL